MIPNQKKSNLKVKMTKDQKARAEANRIRVAMEMQQKMINYRHNLTLVLIEKKRVDMFDKLWDWAMKEPDKLPYRVDIIMHYFLHQPEKTIEKMMEDAEVRVKKIFEVA